MVRSELAIAALAVLIGLAGCGVSGAPSPVAGPDGLRYVALGDSFTIGTSVEPAERFPDQLVARSGHDGADPGAGRQPRRQRLHVCGPRARGAAGPRRSRARVRDRADRGQRCRAGRPDRDVRDHGDDDPRRARRPPPGRSDRYRRDPGLHGHPGRCRLRRPDPAARRDRREQCRHGAARRGARDRVCRHLRPVPARRRRPLARGRRRPPPERRAIRAVGRADPTGRGAVCSAASRRGSISGRHAARGAARR